MSKSSSSYSDRQQKLSFETHDIGTSTHLIVNKKKSSNNQLQQTSLNSDILNHLDDHQNQNFDRGVYVPISQMFDQMKKKDHLNNKNQKDRDSDRQQYHNFHSSNSNLTKKTTHGDTEMKLETDSNYADRTHQMFSPLTTTNQMYSSFNNSNGRFISGASRGAESSNTKIDFKTHVENLQTEDMDRRKQELLKKRSTRTQQNKYRSPRNNLIQSKQNLPSHSRRVSERSFGNQTSYIDQNQQQQQQISNQRAAESDQGVFVTEAPLGWQQSFAKIAEDRDDQLSQSQRLGTSQSNCVVSQSSTSRMTGNRIKFTHQRVSSNPLLSSNDKGSSVNGYFNKNKFGQRINDHVQLLRKSWDQHLGNKGIRTDGGDYGLSVSSTLKQNNYVRFDKQTNRENYQRDPASKCHAARFSYKPVSDFGREDGKHYNIAFAKQKARDAKKFLGIDMEEMKNKTLNEEELRQLQYQIGKMPLRNIPITRDPKLSYTQKPLRDQSINFAKQISRDEVEEPANDKIAQMMDQNKKLDLNACYEHLGHVKSPGKHVNYANDQPNNPKRQAYSSLPRFMSNNANRNGVKFVSEKTLADIRSEDWQFYEPPSTFILQTQSEISQKTAELKAIMQERNQIANAKRLEAIDPSKPKQKKKRIPIWQQQSQSSPSKANNANRSTTPSNLKTTAAEL